jgi:putative molybdopterin biosynthesis protein
VAGKKQAALLLRCPAGEGGTLLGMSVRLSYDFDPVSAVPGSGEPQLGNSLFHILAAIHARGSIGRAAAALGLSYRHVWGVLKERERVFGQPLLASEPGQAARLSAFGERLLWAERRAQARLQPLAEAVAARLDHELLLAAQPALRPLAACASHDLLWCLLRERLRQGAEVLLDVDYLGSAAALARLNEGDCELAGVHLPLGDESLCRRGGGVHQAIGRLLRLGDHKLIRLAHREQGLMVAAGNPLGIAHIADLAREDVTFINRQTGSGTRMLLDELLLREGIPAGTVRGYATEENTHLAVAASVGARLADCGVGLRAAAVRYGLDFVPLLTEQYFVVCHKPALEEPAVQALLEVLRGQEFRRAAGELPGYSAADAGEIISLRRTLPWYK